MFERDNVNVHRAAANIIVSKSRAGRGSVCNALLSASIDLMAKGLYVEKALFFTPPSPTWWLSLPVCYGM